MDLSRGSLNKSIHLIIYLDQVASHSIVQRVDVHNRIHFYPRRLCFHYCDHIYHFNAYARTFFKSNAWKFYLAAKTFDLKRYFCNFSVLLKVKKQQTNQKLLR